MFLRKIKTYIGAHRLLNEGQRVIVALSGGADSVALLHVLRQLGYTPEAVHCNFHLRGEESMRDEQFVRSLCERLNVPLHVVDFDTTEYATANHISIEMAARDLRYDYFRKVANEEGITAVTVAHHLNDSAETFLLNLIRGTGINGLRGIRPKNGLIVRPLLCVTRQEILTFLEGLGQPYVTDSTNLQDDFTRNKIRLKLLPLMQTINPSVQQSIVATANCLSELADVYTRLIEEGKSRVTAPLSEDGESAFAIDAEALLREKTSSNSPKGQASSFAIDSSALLREPMPESLLFELLHPCGFNSAQVSTIFTQLQAETSGRTFLSSTWRIVKDRQRLLVTPLVSSSDGSLSTSSAEAITIEKDGTIHYDDEESRTNEWKGLNGDKTTSNKNDVTFSFGGNKYPTNDRAFEISFDGNKHLSISILQRPEGFVVPRSKTCVCLDADKVQFPLTLRRWQKCDKFVPFGMKGQKNVSDYLTDRKFSLLQKEHQWVLCTADRILWLVGERPDDRFKVQETTSQLIQMELTKSD